jgi:hypothetical protein
MAMDEVHEGNFTESMKNTLQRSASWWNTYKFQKINLSIYDNSQLPFMSQHYIKSTCKFQKTDVSVKTTHKIWKEVLGRMTCKLQKAKFLRTFDMSNLFGNFTNNREIRIESSCLHPCLWTSFHPISPLWMRSAK